MTIPIVAFLMYAVVAHGEVTSEPAPQMIPGFTGGGAMDLLHVKKVPAHLQTSEAQVTKVSVSAECKDRDGKTFTSKDDGFEACLKEKKP